jgi:polysaccharide chain length determinant protein (PEP-CTERM system associated)
MATDYELSLADYISILKRRWLQLMVIFLVIFGVASAVAILLPPIYQSTGTILVESQQIPPDLVKATVTTFADERIEVIRQRVMTRDNLNRIIQKYSLFPDKIDSETTTTLIDIMRSSITVQLLNAELQGGNSSKAIIAFKVGFEYAKPDVAHKVANELITLFLDENVKARTERATETTEFLTQEVDRLKAELEGVENKVATFKQQNANALPEHLTMHMGMMQNTDSQIKELNREYKATQEELRYLDVELASARAAKKDVGTATQVVESDLEKAKIELERSLSLYKEIHPTVRALKRKIEALEKSQTSPPENKEIKSNVENDLMVAKVQAQIEAAKVRLSSIQEQKRGLEAKNSQLQSQVTQSPQVERGLFSLMRDYENAKSKYEEVKSKQINAKIAENLESENKAERFSLLEPPIFPDKPSKPDRKKIIAVGLFAALAGALGIAAMFEAMDKRVRGVDAMTTLLNMRPLVVIPYITTQSEAKRKIKLLKYAVIVSVVTLILGLLIVHFLISPLDLLLIKLMSRFS